METIDWRGPTAIRFFWLIRNDQWSCRCSLKQFRTNGCHFLITFTSCAHSSIPSGGALSHDRGVPSKRIERAVAFTETSLLICDPNCATLSSMRALEVFGRSTSRDGHSATSKGRLKLMHQNFTAVIDHK
ncbi:hypothetical protein D918_06459 [Trichuris suis]|nr:hypothetical protein D918_06459 [Trichuris suis]